MIPAWSYSRLLEYEKCPYSIKLKVIDKVPEPQNKWGARGTQLHSSYEAFIKGETPTLAEELTSFKDEIGRVRDLYAAGKVLVEQEWAHDTNWKTTEWRSSDAWLRLKLDSFIFLENAVGMVVDLKSGRKHGNEIKHAGQGQLYAGTSFLRYPQLKKVITEFWYSDQDDMTSVTYTPQQGAKFLGDFDRRARKMTTAKEFPAKPSIFACKWCAYRPEDAGGNGACKFGVGNISNQKHNARIFGNKR